VGGGLPFAQRRVEQTDGPALGVFHAHDLAGPHQTLVNIRPLPQIRLDRGFRVGKVALETQLPVASEILFGHVPVQYFDAIGHSGLLHFYLL
jgi:hypothetical protein